MATKNINIRIDEELIEKIQKRIAKNKETARGGMEINLSTVVRYSLEKYLEEEEELDRGVVTSKFDLDKLSIEDLKKLSKITEQLHKEFNCGYKETMEFINNCAVLDQAVKYKLYQKQREEEPNKLTDFEVKQKELLEKYKK